MIRIAVTPPAALVHLGPARLAAAIEALLVEARWSRVHLRLPEATARQTADVISCIDPELWTRLTLHDHQGVAASYGTGVQLNWRHRRLMVPRDYIRSLSVSCHSVEEVERVAAEISPDYVTLSPVFDSVSKPGYRASFDLDHLEVASTGVDVIALGGVTPSRVPALAMAGFAGYAVLGSLPWEASEKKLIAKAKEFE